MCSSLPFQYIACDIFCHCNFRWVGMFFSDLICIFTQEQCSRGWILNTLKSEIGSLWANIIQAAIFTLPQFLAAIMMPSLAMGLI